MTTYRSETNWWPPVVTVIILLACTIGPILEDIWLAPVVMVPLIALLVYSYTSTVYTITNDTLIVKAGFYSKQIPVATVRKITNTKSIMTAPALSFTRIEVFYEGYNSVEISPKDKENFIAHLQRINPAIAYSPKTVK